MRAWHNPDSSPAPIAARSSILKGRRQPTPNPSQPGNRLTPYDTTPALAWSHENDQGPAAVGDHRVDLCVRPCPGAPHAMAGPLNEPVPATSASPLCGRTCWSRAGGRGRRTSPCPRPSRGRRAHRPGPSVPGGRRPARRPTLRCGGVPTPSATAHSTRADHATPPPRCR